MAKRVWKIWKNKACGQWICYLLRLFFAHCDYRFNIISTRFILNKKLFQSTSYWYSRAECNEKLLQIQFRILRERYLYPQWRLKVIDIHVKRSESIVIFVAEVVVSLTETVLIHDRRAICAEQ